MGGKRRLKYFLYLKPFPEHIVFYLVGFESASSKFTWMQRMRIDLEPIFSIKGQGRKFSHCKNPCLKHISYPLAEQRLTLKNRVTVGWWCAMTLKHFSELKVTEDISLSVKSFPSTYALPLALNLTFYSTKLLS